ncbi:hypothetical protein HMPREF1011_02235 [Anaerostipes caccae]|nr:hypothetical protein HMPREF1011_02235 [Anaerostipes caccae]
MHSAVRAYRYTALREREGALACWKTLSWTSLPLRKRNKVRSFSHSNAWQSRTTWMPKKLLSRLSSLFQKDDENWVYVDFSRWNPRGEKELFETLKEAILNREVVTFDYYNAKGEYSRREAEPMQLYFRGMDWYLTAFCKKSGEIRIFKLKRLKNLVKTEERFLRKDIRDMKTMPSLEEKKDMEVSVRAEKSLGFRVYDEFDPDWIREEKETFYITFPCADEEWLYGWLLSFGPGLEVLGPKEVRSEMKRRLRLMAGQYEENI